MRARAGAAICVPALALCFALAPGPARAGAPEAPRDPEGLFARGMDLYRGGDYNGAAALFVEAASLRKDFVEARYYAGESLLKGFPTDLPGAEAQFLEAIRLKPGYLDGMLSLAQTYYEWGRYDRCGEILSRVLALSPDHRGALYYSGVIAARRGEYDKAVASLRAALRTDPSHVPSRIELGLALSHLGREEEALAAFQEVLKAEPENGRALFGAGNSLTRLGRADEAKEVLLHFRSVQSAGEKAEMKETRIQLWLLQARKAYGAGSAPEARQAIARLLAEFPDEPRGLASLGWLQEKSGETAEAIATYEKVLKLQPENLTANYQLIGLYARAGRKDLAAARKARYDELARGLPAPPR